MQIHRQRGGQRLAFARLHLDDRAVEHGDAAQHLHVEMPHVDGPPAGLADQGVGLRPAARQRLAALGAIAEREAPLAKLVVGQGLQFRLQGRDLRQQRDHRASRTAFRLPSKAASCDRIRFVNSLTVRAGFCGRSTMSTERSELPSLALG